MTKRKEKGFFYHVNLHILNCLIRNFCVFPGNVHPRNTKQILLFNIFMIQNHTNCLRLSLYVYNYGNTFANLFGSHLNVNKQTR